MMQARDIAIIRMLAPPFMAVPDAPESFKALLDYAYNDSNNALMPVYSGGNEGSIYGEHGNLCFRAWHDACHIRVMEGFSFWGEVKTIREQYRQAKRAGMSKEGLKLLWLDAFGQVCYYYKHKEFVNNQQAFVNHALEHGIREAIKERF